MAEIGTDEHAQIYAQGESIKATVDATSVLLRPFSPLLVKMDQNISGVEPILIEILNTLQSLQANVDQIGDKVIEIDARVTTTNRVVTSMETDVQAVGMDVKGTAATLASFTGWLVPILDDFRDGAILPTMSLIDGKTQTLLDSHNEIKGMVATIQETVNPLLERLESSPLLRMLGVKDKVND